MEKILIQTRKHNGEEYKFYLNSPSYNGEVGILGIEIEPYITVYTPQNCFGYEDIVSLQTVRRYNENGKKWYYDIVVTTTHRYLQPYIKKALKKQMIALMKKLNIDTINGINVW